MSSSNSDDGAPVTVATPGDADIKPDDVKSEHLKELIQMEIDIWSDKRQQNGWNAGRTMCRRKRPGEEDAFQPRVVSIGPFHQRIEELGFMEELKPGFLHSFMSRTINRGHFLKECIKIALEEELALRKFYPYLTFPKYFMKPIVLDACFILDFLIRIQRNHDFSFESKENDECIMTNGKACYEMLNGKAYLMPQIICDLLLLENQLPLSLLSKIYKLFLSAQAEGKNYPKFEKLVITFLDRVTKALAGVAINERYVDDYSTSNLRAQFPDTVIKTHQDCHEDSSAHLLHLYYKFSTNSQKINDTTREIPPEELQMSLDDSLDDFLVMRIPTATTLKESGVTLRRQAPPFSILSISFHGGILELPPFLMGPSTVSLLKNIMELESREIELQPIFTAYIQLLDHIINTGDDVARLRRNRIVEHSYGSDEQAANSFKSLITGHIHYDPHFLMPIYLRVNKYCKSRRKKFLANLKQKHFSSPLSCIALFTAIFLLFLTIFQTLYTILGYYQRK